MIAYSCLPHVMCSLWLILIKLILINGYPESLSRFQEVFQISGENKGRRGRVEWRRVKGRPQHFFEIWTYLYLDKLRIGFQWKRSWVVSSPSRKFCMFFWNIWSQSLKEKKNPILYIRGLIQEVSVYCSTEHTPHLAKSIHVIETDR